LGEGAELLRGLATAHAHLVGSASHREGAEPRRATKYASCGRWRVADEVYTL
jgi:hypothetical protein